MMNRLSLALLLLGVGAPGMMFGMEEVKTSKIAQKVDVDLPKDNDQKGMDPLKMLLELRDADFKEHEKRNRELEKRDAAREAFLKEIRVQIDSNRMWAEYIAKYINNGKLIARDNTMLEMLMREVDQIEALKNYLEQVVNDESLSKEQRYQAKAELLECTQQEQELKRQIEGLGKGANDAIKAWQNYQWWRDDQLRGKKREWVRQACHHNFPKQVREAAREKLLKEKQARKCGKLQWDKFEEEVGTRWAKQVTKIRFEKVKEWLLTFVDDIGKMEPTKQGFAQGAKTESLSKEQRDDTDITHTVLSFLKKWLKKMCILEKKLENGFEKIDENNNNEELLGDKIKAIAQYMVAQQLKDQNSAYKTLVKWLERQQGKRGEKLIAQACDRRFPAWQREAAKKELLKGLKSQIQRARKMKRHLMQFSENLVEGTKCLIRGVLEGYIERTNTKASRQVLVCELVRVLQENTEEKIDRDLQKMVKIYNEVIELREEDFSAGMRKKLLRFEGELLRLKEEQALFESTTNQIVPAMSDLKQKMQEKRQRLMAVLAKQRSFRDMARTGHEIINSLQEGRRNIAKEELLNSEDLKREELEKEALKKVIKAFKIQSKKIKEELLKRIDDMCKMDPTKHGFAQKAKTEFLSKEQQDEAEVKPSARFFLMEWLKRMGTLENEFEKIDENNNNDELLGNKIKYSAQCIVGQLLKYRNTSYRESIERANQKQWGELKTSVLDESLSDGKRDAAKAKILGGLRTLVCEIGELKRNWMLVVETVVEEMESLIRVVLEDYIERTNTKVSRQVLVCELVRVLQENTEDELWNFEKIDQALKNMGKNKVKICNEELKGLSTMITREQLCFEEELLRLKEEQAELEFDINQIESAKRDLEQKQQEIGGLVHAIRVTQDLLEELAQIRHEIEGDVNNNNE